MPRLAGRTGFCPAVPPYTGVHCLYVAMARCTCKGLPWRPIERGHRRATESILKSWCSNVCD